MLSFSSRGNSSSSKSTKVAPFSGFPSKKIPDAHQVTLQLHQLEEELKKEREEKTKVLHELIELKKKPSSQINEYDGRRMEMLEKVEKAKQSERKMHESLVILTRQLEQTKTSLEQARVEISSMKQSKSNQMKTTGGEEVKPLRRELKSALEAEDKATKAMHEFALLLKEVKDELIATKNELDKTKIEVEESAAAWHQKEESFLACVKESTEANNKLKQENTKLFESQKVIREENAKLRENLKKSLEEINTIKEELETVKDENSRLNKVLTEKQAALQTIKLDYESLKVSEAAAQRSLRELNRMLLVETTPKSTSPYFSPCQGCKSLLYAKENGNKSPKAVSVASSVSSLSEVKAASVAITEDTDQLERDFLISADGSEMKKRKSKFFGKFRSFFKGKGFKPIPPLPPSSSLPVSY